MKRIYYQWIQVTLDVLAAVVSGFIVFSLSIHAYALSQQIIIVGLIALACVTGHFVLGSYRQLWRYTSFREIQNVAINSIIIAGLILISVEFQLLHLPLAVSGAFGGLFFTAASGLRLLRRAYNYVTISQNLADSSDINRCLFVGAGDSANALIKDVIANKVPLKIVGILDDDPKKIHAEIRGIPVLGPTTRLTHFIQTLQVAQVVICMPSASPKIVSDLVSRARKSNAVVKVVPNFHDLVQSTTGFNQFSMTLNDLIDGSEFHSMRVEKESLKRSKRVLVTGGAGYIGIHLVRLLAQEGYHVTVLDNFTYTNATLNELQENKNIEIVRGDIANIRDVVACVKNVDTIVALAALVGDPACGVNAEETLNLNYEATKILVEAAHFYQVKRFVFASSCSVYGASDYEYLTENSALNPVSLYARTRIMSEDFILDRCGSVEPVILRLATVFGYSPRMRFDLVVNTLAVRALINKHFQVFGGDQWRPFVHCQDAARAFYLAATSNNPTIAGQVYNVGSNAMNYQLKDVGQIVADMIPDARFELLDNMDDARNYRVRFDKINKTFGFMPQVDLKSGIQEMVQKIQRNTGLHNFQDPQFSNVLSLKQVLVGKNAFETGAM